MGICKGSLLHTKGSILYNYITMLKKNKRYDYEAMKADFFTSKEKTFSAYYRTKFGRKVPGSVAQKVKGWADHKKDFKENGLADAIEDTKNQLRASVRPLVAELETKLANIMKLVDIKIKSAYENAYEIVYDKFGEIVYQTDGKGDYILDPATKARIPMRKLSANISATEINRLYDMVKTELGEPAKIHNSRLTDGDGKNLPPITGVEVTFIKSLDRKPK